MTPAGTTHLIHDKDDHVIVETNGAGAPVREYVWVGDLPVAVLDGSSTPSNPTLLWVHADHLKRPEMMTDATKAVKWKAIYEPFGAVSSITGAASNQQRFPGQWFQLEAGLHYNWWRHYDPTLGRYTQPDPLSVSTPGVGPSVFAYAGNSPLMYTDPDGRFVPIVIGVLAGFALDYAIYEAKRRLCACGDNGSSLGASGYTALGGLEGAVGPFATKPRTGLSGGGLSGSSTSIYSQLVGQGFQANMYGNTGRNVLRGVGRGLSRGIPLAGLAALGYDIYEVATCAQGR